MTDVKPLRQLHHSNGVLTLSFDVCEAVFHYALALNRAERSDLVTIPIVFDGARAESNLLLNPHTQLFCTPATEPYVDAEDPRLVDRLMRLVHELTPQAPELHPVTEADAPDSAWDDAENMR
jgi:hypothetical protein